jgi:AcrR family transcriptional regulator
MTGSERREQLVEVGRALFAEPRVRGRDRRGDRGEGGVSKPVVYEHFGGKEGLYAVVVDREIAASLRRSPRP